MKLKPKAIRAGAFVVALSLIAGAFGSLVNAQVMGTSRVPRLVPYVGTLSQGGSAAAGPVDLAFSIFDGPAAGARRVWPSSGGPETHLAVSLAHGRFSVALGSQIPLPDTLWDSSERYLEVSVGGQVLGGRQRLLSVPDAIQAARAESAVGGLRAELDSLVTPPGSVMAYAGSGEPAGWLFCDGRALPRTGQYASLFASIGTTHGQGDGATTFNLPDYRGRFLRAVDGASGNDPDRATRSPMATGANSGNSVGSVQDSAFRDHTHAEGQWGGCRSGSGAWGPFSGSGGFWDPASCQGNNGRFAGDTFGAGGGLETRPTNAYVNYMIRY